MKRSIKINTVFNIIKMCSSMVLPLITFPYVSRILQPANVGRVNFSETFVGYFSLIACLGISTYGIRECAAVRDNKEELERVSSEIFSLNVITTCLAYVLLLLTLILGNSSLLVYRTIILIQISSILFVTLGADWINSAMEDFVYITIRTLIFQIITLCMIFAFVKKPDDYLIYAGISVFASIGANFVNIFYRKRLCRVRFTLNINVQKHLPPIMWLFAISAVQTIFNSADVTMLGLMKDDYQVGLYTTAHKVTKIIGQLLASVGAVMIPQLSIAFSNNDFGRANGLLKKILLFNFTIGLPCIVGILMMAEDIILVVGGPEFSQAAPVLRLLSLSVLFSLVGGNFLGNVVLIPMKKEKYYMFVCAITAIVNVILNACLIPQFAAVGASIATAVNGFLICVLLLVNVDKNIKIDYIWNTLQKPLMGCVFIVLSCFVCSYIKIDAYRILMKIGCSVITYGISQILFENELVLNTLQSLKNKLMERKV